jgi:hypothetical protein
VGTVEEGSFHEGLNQGLELGLRRREVWMRGWS